MIATTIATRVILALTGSAFGGVKGRTELPGYVDQYMSGEINIDDMVTFNMPLEEINEAFHVMHEGKSIRTVIQMEHK